MDSQARKTNPWEDVPDFTFFFYDPWRSFYSERPVEFRKANGKEVIALRNLRGLIQIGDEAACLLKADAMTISVEEWKELIVSARDFLEFVRADIPLDRFRLVDPDGLPISGPISREDLSSVDLANFLTKICNSFEGTAEMRRTCQALWCLLCFEFIDSAVLAQIYNDAGDGVTAVLDARNALQQAQSLGISTSEPSMAIRGARARHAGANRARAWVETEWTTHHIEYENNKSEFSRHYVRRVLHEFGVTITEKQMREVWLQNTRFAGKPAGMPADGE